MTEQLLYYDPIYVKLKYMCLYHIARYVSLALKF